MLAETLTIICAKRGWRTVSERRQRKTPITMHRNKTPFFKDDPGKEISIGYNSVYKRGRRFSSLEFQRLYGSDQFESHVLRQKAGPEMNVSGLFC